MLGDAMLVLALLGLVGLVCAANMTGRRQRYALAIAATIAAAWVILAVVMRLMVPGTRCVFGISREGHGTAFGVLAAMGDAFFCLWRRSPWCS
jgi:tetrahydromethanopterin S-methyltransferase subunit D